MNNKLKNALIIGLSIIVFLLAIRIIFDKKFDDFSRFVHERENYKDGPAAYDKNLKALDEWVQKYKKDNPGASDEDASAAFNALWNK